MLPHLLKDRASVASSKTPETETRRGKRTEGVEKDRVFPFLSRAALGIRKVDYTTN